MCARIHFSAARLLLVCWLASTAGIAWGWGDEGHEIAGVIASHYLEQTRKIAGVIVAVAVAAYFAVKWWRGSRSRVA